MVVRFSQISLQEAPGKKSGALRPLKAGEKLKDLGEASRFESVLSFNDQLYQSPWIRVQTADGRQGWVFGGGVRPAVRDTQWLFEKRLLCYFGAAAREQRNVLLHSVSKGYAGRNEQDMIADYRAAGRLRDTLTALLAARPESGEAGFQPDFGWLGAVLPGFIFQQIQGGNLPWLFADYRFWHGRALESEGTQDDVFFNTCYALFPADSIESFFPVWTFQLGENEAASMLGSGIHLEILQKLDNAFAACPDFQPELRSIKEALLEDVLEKNTAYWYPADKIADELGRIMASEPACLDDADCRALQARATMFADPEANGIRVGLRSGE